MLQDLLISILGKDIFEGLSFLVLFGGILFLGVIAAKAILKLHKQDKDDDKFETI